MNFFESSVAGFFSSAVAAMGLGGGGVLIIWLLLAGFSAASARGLNLLLFVPSAIVALVIHAKNGLIKPAKLLPTALGGLAGAWVGVLLSNRIPQGMMTRLFGWFLVLIGLRELISAFGNREK